MLLATTTKWGIPDKNMEDRNMERRGKGRNGGKRADDSNNYDSGCILPPHCFSPRPMFFSFIFLSHAVLASEPFRRI